MGTPDSPPKRWTLYDLPVAAKVTLAAFLISVGLGYFSALVNLHFQEATPGKALPDEDDVIRAYHGKGKASQFERLITAHPSLPFNGDGSMRKVFTAQKVTLTAKKRKEVAARMNLDLEKDKEKIRERFYQEVDGERVALIVWLRLPEEEMKQAYENDAMKMDEKLKKVVINPRVVNDDDPKVTTVKVKTIIENRCVSCHSNSGSGGAGQYPLTEWDEISAYTKAEKKGKSLPKLALTTHVHLLGFSMLYGLTGLLLALTPLPGWIRLPLAPAALVAQVIDIAFWWLAQMDEPHGPTFARGIILTGGIVAVSLGLQIFLTLFSTFGRVGKVVLVVLIAGVVGGGLGIGVLPKVQAYLDRERGSMERSEEEMKQEEARKKEELAKKKKEEEEAAKKDAEDKKKEEDDKKKEAEDRRRRWWWSGDEAGRSQEKEELAKKKKEEEEAAKKEAEDKKKEEDDKKK